MQITINSGGVQIITSLEKQDQTVAGTLQNTLANSTSFINALPPQSINDAIDATGIVDTSLWNGAPVS